MNSSNVSQFRQKLLPLVEGARELVLSPVLGVRLNTPFEPRTASTTARELDKESAIPTIKPKGVSINARSQEVLRDSLIATT